MTGKSTARESEIAELRQRLEEAEATIAAIRNGEVDALVVSGDEGNQVFTLSGAEQPYRLFVESMQQGALTLTVDGNILYSNRRFAEMVGRPLEQVIGTSILDYLGNGDREAVHQLLASPSVLHRRVFLQHNGSPIVPAQLAFTVQYIGGTISICVVVTDLTEMEERQVISEALERLKAAQQLLRQQNHDLAEARQAAESASNAKDQFLAQLSHELRTPLTPVLMVLSALEHEQLPPALAGEMSLIRRNIELQTRLIDDLLDLSRVISGKLRLTTSPVDLHTLVHDAVEICRSEATAKHQVIKLQLDAGQTSVMGDAVRLRQILWNLLRNAVKFTPEAGQITVRTKSKDGRCTLFVQDSGIGISEEDLVRIFSPFEQASQNITRRFGGLGLGLAISQRLAQMHGGLITATSKGEGQGSVFRLELPLLEGGSVAPSPAARPPVSVHTKRGRILLVEDHEDTRLLLSRLLSRQHNVQVAGTVASAVAAAKHGKFDLILSDLGLPDGTGYDVMARIRRLQPSRGIALSGFGTDADLQKSRAAGFLSHLVKPVSVQELLSAIDEALSTPASPVQEE